MMKLAEMISPLIVLPAGVQALLVLRLLWTGLSRRYPAFTVWMAFSAISMVTLLAFSSLHGTDYRNAWIARQLLGMAVLFAALVELTSRILEHYPGLRRVTASGLFGLLLAASIVATAGESLDKPVRFFLMMQTGWNGATSLYVMVLVGLATYLDPRRRLNVILHERIFAGNCLLAAVFFLFAVAGNEQKDISNWVGAAGGVIFPLLWMRMSPAGEVDRRSPVTQSADAPSFAETQATLERLEKFVTRSGG